MTTKEKIFSAIFLFAWITAWITHMPMAEMKETLLLLVLAYLSFKVGNLETRLRELEEDARRRQAA